MNYDKLLVDEFTTVIELLLTHSNFTESAQLEIRDALAKIERRSANESWSESYGDDL